MELNSDKLKNMAMQKCDLISYTLSDELERQGITAIAVWRPDDSRGW